MPVTGAFRGGNSSGYYTDALSTRYVLASEGGAGIASAYEALGTGGGLIVLGQGEFLVSETLTFNTSKKPVIIEGQGGAVLGYGTKLTWTGGGGPLISIGANCRGTHLRAFSINNTGTGTIGVKVDGGSDFKASDLTIFPTVGFSDAGMSIGPTTAHVGASLERLYMRGNAVNLRLGRVGSHLSAFGVRLVFATENNLVVGSSTLAADSLYFGGCTFDSTTALGSNVLINRLRAGTFAGCYFEHRDGAYAIEIPSTAGECYALTVLGGFMSAAEGVADAAIYSNFPSTSLTVIGVMALGYANPSYLFKRDTSPRRVLLMANDLKDAGMVPANSYGNVTVLGNTPSTGIDQGFSIDGGVITTAHLSGTATWNPASLIAGAQATTTVTVTGAALGNVVAVGASIDLQGLMLTGYVSASNTVTLVLHNGTSGTVDLGSGTFRADVWKH